MEQSAELSITKESGFEPVHCTATPPRASNIPSHLQTNLFSNPPLQSSYTSLSSPASISPGGSSLIDHNHSPVFQAPYRGDHTYAFHQGLEPRCSPTPPLLASSQHSGNLDFTISISKARRHLIALVSAFQI